MGETTNILRIAILGAISLVLIGAVALNDMGSAFESAEPTSLNQSAHTISYFTIVDSLGGNADIALPGARNEQARFTKNVAWLSWVVTSQDSEGFEQETALVVEP